MHNKSCLPCLIRCRGHSPCALHPYHQGGVTLDLIILRQHKTIGLSPRDYLDTFYRPGATVAWRRFGIGLEHGLAVAHLAPPGLPDYRSDSSGETSFAKEYCTCRLPRATGLTQATMTKIGFCPRTRYHPSLFAAQHERTWSRRPLR